MDIKRQIAHKLQLKYKNLSEAELEEKVQEKQQKQLEVVKELQETLKKALKSGQYLKNPRGRPRRGYIFQYAVKPSTIKRRYKEKIARVTSYLKHELFPVLKEYKQYLGMVVKDVPIEERKDKIKKKDKDIYTFRFRKPTKEESELIGDSILPSKFFGKKFSADVDIKLYQHERLDMFDKDVYKFYVGKFVLSTISTTATRTYNILREKLVKVIKEDIEKNKKGYEFYVHIKSTCIFGQDTREGYFEYDVYIGSKTHRREEAYVSNEDEMNKVFKLCLSEIREKLDVASFGSREASGASFVDMREIEVILFRYHGNKLINITHEPAPIGYRYRELPEWIRKSCSIINMQNKDDSCFKWCVARFFYREKNNEFRITKLLRQNANKIEWFGLDDPKNFNEENLCKFEDHHNLRIIVF
jgi:hypothetical protein